MRNLQEVKKRKKQGLELDPHQELRIRNELQLADEIKRFEAEAFQGSVTLSNNMGMCRGNAQCLTRGRHTDHATLS